IPSSPVHLKRLKLLLLLLLLILLLILGALLLGL
nr:Chain A, rSP-C33Leu -RECOMBINANT PULMONARY SURFACTANT-ASSOCIATED POLYPEPTIDE C ANALOGUE- [Sus scrofa]